MARTKQPNRMKANRFLNFNLQHSGSSSDSHYIDLAAALSKTNRSLYRQGKIYTIKRISVINAQEDVQLRVATAPCNWVTKAAWRRGKKTWDKMNREAAATLEGKQVYPKWHDYKVMLNPSMMGDADQPEPVDINNNVFDAGEWAYSQYETPDGTATADAFFAHLLGDHSGSAGSRTSVGLIQSYGESRGHMWGMGSEATPTHDSQFEHDPLANLFDYGTVLDEVLENLDSDNDLPPYAVGTGDTIGDHYPGAGDNAPSACLVSVLSCTDITGGQPVDSTTGPIDVMCGLLEIETTSATSQSVELLIELQEGSYKGVAAYEI
tara:strand:- start:117 stop:1082 length:966 start_codon:yes stop_codon:yes gene_type:complete